MVRYPDALQSLLLARPTQRLARRQEGEGGLAASVLRAVKEALLTLLRCRAPAVVPWHRKVLPCLAIFPRGWCLYDLLGCSTQVCARLVAATGRFRRQV